MASGRPGQQSFWPPWGRRARDLAKQPGDPGVLMAWVRQSHPPLLDAVRADVGAARRFRGEPAIGLDTTFAVVREAVRLAAISDSFAGQCCYRMKAAAQRRGVPVLPHVLHRLAIVLGQVCIGDPVHVEPGLYLPHGQVVVDGITTIGAGVVLYPFTTLGLKAGNPHGPTLHDGAQVGTGAKVIGAVTVGERAMVGANAVVVDDVAPGATVIGAPARPSPARRGRPDDAVG
ncbi:MAG: hypothetical protein KF906_00895 [Actinobacteria bacterium]|nr:hypothetical protein [Actinomycetota bacterium]